MNYRRLPSHDYRGTGFYFITFATEPRRPLLSEVSGGRIHLKPEGEAVVKAAERIPAIHRAMQDYLTRGVLREAVTDGFVLVQRRTDAGVSLGLVGVIDLAALLGNVQQRSEQLMAETSLLALNPALEVNAALLVDRLMGLRSIDAFVSSEPSAEDAPVFFGTTYLDSSGTRWQELNLQTLSQHPAFLSIRA